MAGRRGCANRNMIENIPIQKYTKKAYLEYSMYVILHRALPHIIDGLKPVQRRIIFAMSELGLKNNSKFKKSARTVGDVLGKYHPHGDTACYEAMVLMAQPFSFRYPLIEGQGNWGSVDDPSSFAAMRYTEAKLSAISNLLLQEVHMGAVSWKENFDGSAKEPLQFPSRLPFALLNGASGIAVGMATDIPPHNLNEIVEGCQLLLKNSRTSISELTSVIKAPDFPFPCEIVSSREEINNVYETGHGTIKLRSRYQVHKNNIIVDAIPYQTTSSKIVIQIANLIQAKKLPMVVNIRDESDHKQTVRIVIGYLPRIKSAAEIMDHLFIHTDLEKSIRVNLNLISRSGSPKVYSLKSLLLEWIEGRKHSVRLRINQRLTQLKLRLDIISGLLIIYANINDVIEIIRNHDNPKKKLIRKFKLTETQTEAILEIKLRQLAKLEEKKLCSEKMQLQKEEKELKLIVSSDTRLKTLIRKEIEADKQTYGDKRRCPIVKVEAAKSISIDKLVVKKDITIILSINGWIRQANGHNFDASNLAYKASDSLLTTINAKTNLSTIYIDNKGRTYTTTTHDYPSSKSLGEPLSSRINLKTGSTFVGLVNGADNDWVALVTSNGYGFQCQVSDMKTRNKNGKAFLAVGKGKALCPALINDGHLALLTKKAKLLIIKASRLAKMEKGKGNKIFKYHTTKRNPDEVCFIKCLGPKQGLKIVLENGKKIELTPKKLEQYHGKIATSGKLVGDGKNNVIHAIIKK